MIEWRQNGQRWCTSQPSISLLSRLVLCHGKRNVHVHFNFSLAPSYLFDRKYYDLLDTSPDCSEAELKKAYRKKYGPLTLR